MDAPSGERPEPLMVFVVPVRATLQVVRDKLARPIALSRAGSGGQLAGVYVKLRARVRLGTIDAPPNKRQEMRGSPSHRQDTDSRDAGPDGDDLTKCRGTIQLTQSTETKI